MLSDIHLAEAEPTHPKKPLWKRYKRAKHFVDKPFGRLLAHVWDEAAEGEVIELVLNGDVFDFDSVMALPDPAPFPVSWLERRRGLHAEQEKSRFKLGVILRDHPVFVQTLREHVLRGHRLVFVIGNHDLELHWPAVRETLRAALDLPPERQGSVRICEWFYVSNADTLIEHGNQFDAYCTCVNPVRPLIRRRGRTFVRLPFGNLASRLMVNGMGLFNPHVESSFLMSFPGYVRFFFKYLLRTQPGLLWTWFWSAFVTLLYSLNDGLHPAIKDPITFGRRVEEMAARSNSTTAVLLSLQQLHVHPAVFNPFKIARELWLDRAAGLLAIFGFSTYVVLVVNAIVPIDILWVLLPIGLLLPGFLFYAASINSDVYAMQRASLTQLDPASRITGLRRVVQGHTHREMHGRVGAVEFLNTGTWSPAFRDPECRQPFGRRCFAWIRPGPDGPGSPRVSVLYEWTDPGLVPLPDAGEIEPPPAHPHRPF